MSNPPFVQWFRQSAPYIHAHRGKTCVLMINGETIAHPNFAELVHDIALLNSLGLRIVLCHGARPQIQAQMDQQSINSEFHSGNRITDANTMQYVINAVSTVRTHIESLFSMGLPNSPMHGANMRVTGGNLVVAKPAGVIDGVDYQHTGKIRRIEKDTINHFLDQGHIVLLSTLGYSISGEIFNLSLDDLTLSTAIALHADKVIAFDSLKNIDIQSNALRALTTLTAKQLANEKQHATLNTLVDCCEQGVARCHLIDYQDDGALLQELFTRDGAGLLVSHNNFQHIRPATINDVAGILSLLQPLEENGALVKRSRELLENEISQFTVVVRDDDVIACAALYPYDDNSAELACIVTSPAYQKQQLATLLLDHLQNQATTLGIQKLFVLTTQTAHWFIEKGFQEASINELPDEKKRLYNYQRNSKVFKKPL